MQKLLESLPKILITPDFYRQIPETAGVYSYFHNGNVIYVGKAINLKKRISSYFDLDLDIKTARMISEATHLSYIQVDSELEALLLEAKLIRTYLPHYNIAAKDDKHPLYIRITKEEFPRVIVARKIAESEKNLAFYGPFPSSRSVYSVLRMIRRIFPYSDHKIGKRACIYSHIGLCSPCPSEILTLNDDDKRKELTKVYRKNIRFIKSILDGKVDSLEKKLERDMKSLSNQQKYEDAARIRNQINHLEYITRPSLPTEFYLENPNLYEDTRRKELGALEELTNIKNIRRIECFDVAHLAGSNATASMVTFIEAEPDKDFYRHFRIKRAKGGDDYGSMREVSERRRKNFASWGTPDLIIVDGGVGQVNAFKEKISEVPIVGIAKHPDRLILDDKKIRLSGLALNLVSRMRDEAHRFARRYHHSLISNSLTHANDN